MFTGESILLVVPYHFGLPTAFKENLTKLGFTVYLFPEVKHIKISVRETIIHGYRKFILKDKTYKAACKARRLQKLYENYLASLPDNIDYALVIRPDLLSKEIIGNIRAKVKLMAAYQWDGMDRYPLAKQRIADFDRFFVFDAEDLEKYPGTLPATNFYFDAFTDNASSTENRIFFVGTFMYNRIEQLKALGKFFTENGYKTDILLYDPRGKLSDGAPGITVLHKPLTFEENLRKLQKASVLLDFKNDVHRGLSFRNFESVGFRKKLITNNELVAKYDFYHPDNIFILKDDSWDGLKEFMEKPYRELPEDIYKKYSFTNWIRYILDIDPHVDPKLIEK